MGASMGLDGAVKQHSLHLPAPWGRLRLFHSSIAKVAVAAT